MSEIISRMEISNNQGGSKDSGHYSFKIDAAGLPEYPGVEFPAINGEYKGFPRLQLPVWALLHAILDQTYGLRERHLLTFDDGANETEAAAYCGADIVINPRGEDVKAKYPGCVASMADVTCMECKKQTLRAGLLPGNV